MPTYNLTTEQKQIFDRNKVLAGLWKKTTEEGVNWNDAVTYTSVVDTACVRVVSGELSGFTTSFNTEMLPQEQMVSQEIHSGFTEHDYWSMQRVSSSDQCSVSISGTENLGEEVSNKGTSDGMSFHQKAYPVVEGTPRSFANKMISDWAYVCSKVGVDARLLKEAEEVENRWKDELNEYVMGKEMTIKDGSPVGNHWLDK